MRARAIGMWIWLVGALILGFLLILSNQDSTEAPTIEMDEEDDLLEEFLIIDLLDEEEEDQLE